MYLPIDKVKNLYYKEGLSSTEVGKRLGFSVWQVIKFMKKNNLPRRSSAETNNLNYESKPPSFKPKSSLTNKEKQLKTAGLMIYLGEGSKKNSHTVDLANSDVLTIKLFLKMLREIYRVKEEKLRIYLYCYANQNPEDLIEHWSNLTKIPKNQFSKPYIRKDFLESKINKMPHGLVHIRYNDKKLLSLFKKEIETLINKLLLPG